MKQMTNAGLPSRMFEAGNAAISHLLHEVSGGSPLEPAIRKDMEEAFDTNFSEVRIHDDPVTEEKAAAVNAEAFTQDDHIYLGEGAPSLQSSDGRKLLAHELAHVVQKRQAGGQQSSGINQPGDGFEVEADRAAASAAAGRPVHLTSSGAPPVVQRQSSGGLVENLVDKALTSGISLTQDGWAVGGVTLNDLKKAGKAAEMSGEVLERVAKGNFREALDLVNPKDADEEKRLLEKFRKLKEKMDAVKDEGERKRDQEEKTARHDEAVREGTKRLGVKKREPKSELIDPDSDTRFTMGATTPYVVDDFNLEKADLKPAHKRKLNEVASRASSNPNAEIEIVGHADTTGKLAFNKTLSENRANAVRDYLISQGVEPGKIKLVSGKGNEEPLIPEKTDADRARNRRVEIRYWAGAVEKKRKTYGFGLGKLKLDL
ncbi:MAG: DUF4157 domain-containing protein [Pyrinomonadaceae bacterium]|nr:DUF4157 domain-containing protein [Pyrinomonadaceae bacterium]